MVAPVDRWSEVANSPQFEILHLSVRVEKRYVFIEKWGTGRITEDLYSLEENTVVVDVYNALYIVDLLRVDLSDGQLYICIFAS